MPDDDDKGYWYKYYMDAARNSGISSPNSVGRRVKGYTWRDGFALVHRRDSELNEADEDTPISEEEAKFYGWSAPDADAHWPHRIAHRIVERSAQPARAALRRWSELIEPSS